MVLKNLKEFDYLLNMNLMSLSLERAQKIEKELLEFKIELDRLEQKNYLDFWNEDLELFIEKLELLEKKQRIEKEKENYKI